jgi:hypothetical protein
VASRPLSGFEADNASARFAGNGDLGDDRVTIPDSGVFNFASTRVFTLEAWVKGWSGQEAGAAIIAKGTGGGGEQFAIDVFNGTYRFFAWDGAAPNTPFVAGASVGPDGTWQHRRRCAGSAGRAHEALRQRRRTRVHHAARNARQYDA